MASEAAGSTVVRCGQIVTTSIRLANDLVNCPGDGLVIGASHITVDLAGHSISGVNARGSEGIADDGHGNVLIQNGTIKRFFLNGVGLRSAPHSVVSHMTIRQIGAGGGESDASAGVQLKNSPYSSVVGSAVSNDVSAFQSDGVDVLSSQGSTIRGNALTNNAWDGMVVLFSPETRVIGNVLKGNKNQGFELNQGSDRSSVIGNYAANNADDGLIVGAVSGLRVENNILQGNPDGGLFMFDLHGSWISHNLAFGNGAGIDLEGGQNGSTNNVIANNDTSRNQFVGLVLENVGADHNLVTANIADDNKGASADGGGGIVLATANGNTVRDNVAVGNRAVGIGVFEQSPGDTKHNVLTRNVVVRNRDHGIDAVAGTVDGGGNVARNNTPLPNCLGVACSA